MKASHLPLFHQILEQLKKKKITKKKLLIAVSGGVDSIALLDLVYETSKILKLKYTVAHIHHGLNVSRYRNKTQIFVHSLCEGMCIPFLTNEPQQNKISSETQMRQFRYKYLNQWMEKYKYDYLVLAHTIDDLLETRLIRMIRGTGKEGLSSMQFLQQNQLRPLIHTTKTDILQYAQMRKLEWIEDPSNQNSTTIRNWIRKKWLPKLEKKRAGSIHNLSQSLERISQALLNNNSYLLHTQSLPRKEILQCTLTEQRQWLASYMKQKRISNYTHRHIEELLKHIRSNKKNIKLFMLGKGWLITLDEIRIQD